MSIQQPGLAVAHHGGTDGWRLRFLRCFRAQPVRDRLNPQLVEACWPRKIPTQKSRKVSSQSHNLFALNLPHCET